MISQSKRILVDGRVFSTAAFDRGMGRYVVHLLALLEQADYAVTLLLFRNCCLEPDSPLLSSFDVRFADYDPEHDPAKSVNILQEMHHFTAFLSALIETEGYQAYLDGTPFIAPLRLDIVGCPVLAVCYDFIPLRHPDFYLQSELGRAVYYNGLARLVKADVVISISKTVRDEAARYLAIPAERQVVLHPTVEDRYLSPPPIATPGDAYLFSILGFHKSKNPGGALKLCEELASLPHLGLHLNVPKPDQMDFIQTHFAIPDRVRMTASISDAEKFEGQANASVIAHFSLEEGFGIPLLEAFFLHRKVLALDTPINREFLENAGSDDASGIFFLAPIDTRLDLPAFTRFLDAPVDPAFFESICSYYIDHWKHAAAALKHAVDVATDHFRDWNARIQARLFSSIPGTSCGVADYSVAYTRSATGNVLFFFSEGKQENITLLPNIKALTYLDYELVARSPLGEVPALFNFAFSPALNPGIDLMRRHARANDVMLIHERRYFDGLRSMLQSSHRGEQMVMEMAADERKPLAVDFLFHPLFNNRTPIVPVRAPVSSSWLKALRLRMVHHLPPPVVGQMQALQQTSPGSVINDLADIEDQLEFVPLGIDDRHHPSVARAAVHLRTLRGIQQDDLVLGHCGLIVNDVKRLWGIAQAVAVYAQALKQQTEQHRRLFFVMVGKVIDQQLFDKIGLLFKDFGIADHLVHTNPAQEIEFDAEIVACDAVFCFRTQNRGQLSHVLVRALSLGTPVIVNERSGYGFDPRLVVDDQDLFAGIKRVLDLALDPANQSSIRTSMRQQYEDQHRGDKSLAAMLNGTSR